MSQVVCYCGTQKQYEECCAPFINFKQDCKTPEQLMRSRYSAFATGSTEYLLFTSSNTLKKQLTAEDLQRTIDAFSFIKLSVLQAQEDTVEFCAHLLTGNEHHQLKEKSKFIKEQGLWKYDSGVLEDIPVIKLTRNAPCPCGSGKKFKKCHQA